MTYSEIALAHRGYARRLSRTRQSVAAAMLPQYQPPAGKGKRLTVEDVAGHVPGWDDAEQD